MALSISISIYIYNILYATVQYSMAVHQRTVGIPAGGGRADTPAGGEQAGIPAGAMLRMGIHMLTLWGKEDTEEEAVPWELGNIKFQVG
jgi:hypothetical protein